MSKSHNSLTQNALDNWLGNKIANRNSLAILTALDDRLELASAVLVKGIDDNARLVDIREPKFVPFLVYILWLVLCHGISFVYE